MNNYTRIDVPFEERHRCWFCGEPSAVEFNFPLHQTDIAHLSHEPLTGPSCQECSSIVKQDRFTSINYYRDAVKTALARKYQKALGIGLNWTEQELIESDFEGAAFEGFKRSAWLMHTIAKERVNYPGWPLSLGGVSMNQEVNSASFEFDGIRFAELEAAIDHYIKTFHLDARLLRDMVQLVGQQRFAYAIRICRLYPIVSSDERQQILKDIADNQREGQHF